MKKFPLILTLCLAAAMSYAQNTLTSKYLPMDDQVVYKGNLISYDANNKAVMVDANNVPHDCSLLRLFPNTLSTMTVFSVDPSGNLAIAGNGGKVDKGTYFVVYEFSMFQPVNMVTERTSVTYCVGISVRLMATVNTMKNNTDLSQIISIASQDGKNKSFSGHMQIVMKGINSPTLTGLNPIPINGASFTADNVATALEAIAAIKSHFTDKDVIITPEVLGFYQTYDGNSDKSNYAKNVKAIKQELK
jgi:hypothetical protein